MRAAPPTDSVLPVSTATLPPGVRAPLRPTNAVAVGLASGTPNEDGATPARGTAVAASHAAGMEKSTRVAPASPGSVDEASGPHPEPDGAERAAGASLETILAEIRALRRLQEAMLSRLTAALDKNEPDGQKPSGSQAFGYEPPDPDEHASVRPSLPSVRNSRRKSALLIDDDDATRSAAVSEFEQAEVPMRAFSDGNSALRAIAEDKPDVIALELDLSGSMAGKDVINMIKATMEWVDIPIILYTRLAVESQKEARTIHGADEVVLKRSGACRAVARTVTLFRRG